MTARPSARTSSRRCCAGSTRHAAASAVPLLALKDVVHRDAAWAAPPLAAAGFTRVATLPVATLHLPFASVEAEYLASLSASMRSDLQQQDAARRRRRHRAARQSIDGIENEIDGAVRGDERAPQDRLRRLRRRAGQLLPRGDGRHQPATRASCVCRVGGELVSFNLFLVERDRVIGKYIGMRYALAREHNLYFVNWMATVRLCIERGIPWLQTGHTSYRQKVRLGCQLKRSWIYFKYRNAADQPAVQAVRPAHGVRPDGSRPAGARRAGAYLDAGAAP